MFCFFNYGVTSFQFLSIKKKKKSHQNLICQGMEIKSRLRNQEQKSSDRFQRNRPPFWRLDSRCMRTMQVRPWWNPASQGPGSRFLSCHAPVVYREIHNPWPLTFVSDFRYNEILFIICWMNTSENLPLFVTYLLSCIIIVTSVRLIIVVYH